MVLNPLPDFVLFLTLPFLVAVSACCVAASYAHVFTQLPAPPSIQLPDAITSTKEQCNPPIRASLEAL